MGAEERDAVVVGVWARNTDWDLHPYHHYHPAAAPPLSSMLLRWLLCALLALSAEADFFQLDSISNVSTYYFNYFYCNIWEGDCQPHQDDATQQGKMALRPAGMKKLAKLAACRASSWLFLCSCVTVPTRDVWSSFPHDYIGLLHQWYCSLGQCCESGDCRITNNITGEPLHSVCSTRCMESYWFIWNYTHFLFFSFFSPKNYTKTAWLFMFIDIAQKLLKSLEM